MKLLLTKCHRSLIEPLSKMSVILASCLILSMSHVSVGIASEEKIFISAADFDVTARELRLYLQAPVQADGTIVWGSPERVQQAISDLYVLKVLARRGVAETVLSEEEQKWIAYYNVALANVRGVIARDVQSMLEDTDWYGEAREYYLAEREEFTKPESLTVRTMLLKTEKRSIAEAIVFAERLLSEVITEEDFARIVVEHTEDSGNPDGELVFSKGQTVPEFEAAAFALDEIGAISEPVVSQFGVHVIQLLERNAGSVMPFEEVQDAIISRLKQIRAEEAAGFVKTSPHREPPADVRRHDDVINEFLSSVTAQYRAAQPSLPSIE